MQRSLGGGPLKRRAGHLHERGFAAATRRVDAPCDRLSPGSLLSANQRRRVGCGRNLHHLAQLPGGGTGSDDLRVPYELLEQLAIAVLQAALPQRVAQHEQRAIERQRLLHEVERAELGRPHRGVDRPVTGDHHDLDVVIALAQAAQRVESVDARKPHVQQNGVVGVARERLQSRLPALDDADPKPLVAQDRLERRANPRLVVDHQYPLAGHQASFCAALGSSAGNSITNRAPWGRFGSTRIVP